MAETNPISGLDTEANPDTVAFFEAVRIAQSAAALALNNQTTEEPSTQQQASN